MKQRSRERREEQKGQFVGRDIYNQACGSKSQPFTMKNALTVRSLVATECTFLWFNAATTERGLVAMDRVLDFVVGVKVKSCTTRKRPAMSHFFSYSRYHIIVTYSPEVSLSVPRSICTRINACLFKGDRISRVLDIELQPKLQRLWRRTKHRAR